jgi:hypothetical protein
MLTPQPLAVLRIPARRAASKTISRTLRCDYLPVRSDEVGLAVSTRPGFCERREDPVARSVDRAGEDGPPPQDVDRRHD